MKDKLHDITAGCGSEQQVSCWTGDGSSTMLLDDVAPDAQSRIAALLPSFSVTCHITHRAYYRLVNFKRRGGPEPTWYVYRDWNAETGENEWRDRTPEQEAQEEVAVNAYVDGWNFSLTERRSVIAHAMCEAVKSALSGETSSVLASAGGFPNGYIGFSVPEDMSPEEPPVKLAVCCEPGAGDAQSRCLVVVCIEEMVLATRRAL